MKKIQANRREKALKELEAIDKSLIVKVGEEINEKDKKMYHAILVKITDRPGQAKNDVSVIVQTYHQRGFEKIKKSFAFQGFNKIILLHDPSLLNEEDLKTVPQPTKSVPTNDEIEAEIERRAKEKANEIIASQNKDNNDDDNDGDDVDEQGVPIYGSTVKEMKAFAKAKEIDLTGLKSKEEIENALSTWVEDQK